MLAQPMLNANDPPLTQPLDLSGVQVLVVDDDVDTRDFMVFLLEEVGANVIAVGSADEALVALEQSSPNLLISDIGMPKTDGYMLIQDIRSRTPEQGGTIPAIALTAYAGEFNEQRSLEAGFQQHLCKPIEPDELLAIVAALAKAEARLEELP